MTQRLKSASNPIENLKISTNDTLMNNLKMIRLFWVAKYMVKLMISVGACVCQLCLFVGCHLCCVKIPSNSTSHCSCVHTGHMQREEAN